MKKEIIIILLCFLFLLSSCTSVYDFITINGSVGEPLTLQEINKSEDIDLRFAEWECVEYGFVNTSFQGGIPLDCSGTFNIAVEENHEKLYFESTEEVCIKWQLIKRSNIEAYHDDFCSTDIFTLSLNSSMQ